MWKFRKRRLIETRVGWVEPQAKPNVLATGLLGFASLNPTYALALSLVVAGCAEQDAASTPLPEGPFALGREATPAEVAAWDIDVKPDGEGLPDGQGTAAEGEPIYARRCALCHGDFGEGRGRWPVLAGGQDTLKNEHPVKTIGSYWPNLSTVFDYVYRAMPFGHAQSLTPDELYAVVAYLLDLNYLLEDPDMVLSRESFASITMPNAGGFIPDDRPDTPGVEDRPPCMHNCKDEVGITMRARVLDVTPEQ